MIIHVVQPGETIYIIAGLYHISAEIIIRENGLTDPDNLAIGQSLIIAHPELIYTIQEGDTLFRIAENYNVSVMELLRNNPYLSDRESIYPGETIIIRYQTSKIGKIAISGYAYPYMDKDTLKKTLPFLTYLTIFNYQATREGGFIDIDDTEMIQTAKDYGVAPMMFVSTLSEQGRGNIEAAYNIVNNPEVQQNFINNVLTILKSKGYYGLNIFTQYLNLENRPRVEELIADLANILHSEGYRLIVTVTPRTIIDRTEIYFEGIDYSNIAESADGMAFLSHEWSIINSGR